MPSFWDYLPVDKLAQTWPARMAESIGSALMAPGRAYQSTEPITTEQMVAPAADLAGLVTLGAYGMPAVQGGAGVGIRAYHGSPHDFDKFDMSRIGTGEGAQAYGHGLYFAENPAVAADYKRKLAYQASLNGADRFDEQALKYVHTHGGLEQARAAVDAEIKQWASNPSTVAYLQELKKAIREPNPGRMYEVNINARPDQFLDWDKPLSGQPDILNRLNSSGSLRSSQDPASLAIHRAQRNRYNAADLFLGGQGELGPLGPAEVSSKLREAGIPGIKYLDQGSRAAGDGSSNYVVFDDKIIDILKKYGIAGMGMLGMGAASQQQPVLGMEQ